MTTALTEESQFSSELPHSLQDVMNEEMDSGPNNVDTNIASNEDSDVINKDHLRQSSNYLDDPSQFYFDDDIPTPEVLSSTGSGTNENSIDDVIDKQETHQEESSDEDYESEEDEEKDNEDVDNVSEEEEEEEESVGDKIRRNERSENVSGEETDDFEDGSSENEEQDERKEEKQNEENSEHDGGDMEEEEEEGSIIMDEYEEASEGEDERELIEDEDNERESIEEEEGMDVDEENEKELSLEENDDEDISMGGDNVDESEESMESDSKDVSSEEIEEDKTIRVEKDEEETRIETFDREVPIKGDEKELDDNGKNNEEVEKENEEELNKIKQNIEDIIRKDIDSQADLKEDEKNHEITEKDETKQNTSEEQCSNANDETLTPMNKNIEDIKPEKVLRRSSRSFDRGNKTDEIKDKTSEAIAKEKTLNDKTNKVEPVLGFTKSILDGIKIKKEVLLLRIDNIDKFLDVNINCKEFHEAERKLEERLQVMEKTRFNGMRISGKRKRDDSQEEVKKAPRGRPKGWTKVKQEATSPVKDHLKVEHKPIVKRRKRDEILLMKALDEEMFKMDEESNKEMERISQGLDYQCSVCSQVFEEKKNLSKHFFKCLMKFTQSGRSSFKCSICFEYFSLVESLESHIERKHEGICEEPFQCSQCSLCFEQGGLLKAHVLEKHEVFQCIHCQKYYRNQLTLDVHLNKKHPLEKGEVKVESTEQASSSRKPTENETPASNRSKRRVSNGTGTQDKLEPPSNTVEVKTENVTEVRVKKLGRPSTKKSIDATATSIQAEEKPVQKIPKAEATKTSRGNIVKTEPKENEPTTPSLNDSMEDNELGRGRRVKKKKQLDYEDSISSTPGRRSKRKSTETSLAQEDKSKKESQNDARSEFKSAELVNGGTQTTERGFSSKDKLVEVLKDKVELKKEITKSIPKEQVALKEEVLSNVNAIHSTNDQVIEDLDKTVEKLDSSTPKPTAQDTKAPLFLHRKIHLCPKCRKPFSNKFLVKIHMKRKHNIFKRSTVIDPTTREEAGVGGKRSLPPPSSSPSDREALFICSLCGENFPMFHILEDHYLRAHDGIPCGACRILIKNRMLLDKHLNTCHGPEERYVCPVCDKQMKSKQTLRKHIDMHEDRRPYDCAVCKRSFRYSYDMRLHMKRTHTKVWQVMRQTTGDLDAL